MNKEELKYVLEALNYGLNNCNDELEDKSTHFNLFANAINLVETEMKANEVKASPSNCNKTVVSNVHIRLPRPLEAYKKALEAKRFSEFCEWYLEQEKRG